MCCRYCSETLGWSRQPTVLASAVVAPLCWTLSIFPMERVKVEQQAVGAIKEGVGQTIGTVDRSSSRPLWFSSATPATLLHGRVVRKRENCFGQRQW
jgi:hypothetical protein